MPANLSDFDLSPEQIAEIERRVADDGPYATDEEASEVFVRLTKQNTDLCLSPEQIAEIERCMSDDEPFASEEEVQSVLEQLTK